MGGHVKRLDQRPNVELSGPGGARNPTLASPWNLRRAAAGAFGLKGGPPLLLKTFRHPRGLRIKRKVEKSKKINKRFA